MSDQLRLFEFRMGERDPRTHVVSASNEGATRLLLDWPRWPGGVAVLSGPEGAGKTHLARVWAEDAAAGAWTGLEEEARTAFERFGGRLLVDDADRIEDEAGLIRLFDLSRAHQGAVLFVGRPPAASWPVSLPDLRSRLASAPEARLCEPDDVLLGVVLRRVCRERFMELTEEAVQYLAVRMDRSFAGVGRLADALERVHIRGARPISVPVARRALAESGAGQVREGDEQ